MTTTWNPSTCHCLAEWEEPYQEGRSGKLLKKCRTHDTFADTLAHERAIMLTHGRTTTENQKDSIRDLAILERKKAIYQRR